MSKPVLWLLLPATIIMTLCGLIPLGFVLFYSVHDTFAGNDFVFVGSHWFQQILTSPDFYGALGRSALFAALCLAIQIPLGLWIALKMPANGFWASAFVALFALPLLTPSLVVGYLWKIMTIPKAGLLVAILPIDLNSVSVTWAVLLAMDAWHWTGLIILLCYAALRSIPQAYYQAAQIDGASRWSVFRHVELPRLQTVLLIAILIRLMDSFMIFSEAIINTRGGPGVSTTFLSHELVQTALIQFDLGEGAALSVVYFLIVLAVSWSLFRLMPMRQKKVIHS
jgi:glycerol transport system permease protein